MLSDAEGCRISNNGEMKGAAQTWDLAEQWYSYIKNYPLLKRNYCLRIIIKASIQTENVFCFSSSQFSTRIKLKIDLSLPRGVKTYDGLEEKSTLNLVLEGSECSLHCPATGAHRGTLLAEL